MKFFVHGVHGQGRPRFTRNGSTYETREDKEYKALVQQEYIAAGGINYGSAPISMYIFVYSPLPKSRKKSITEEEFTVKPDADNIAKAIMDALNGVAYDDDKQVVSLQVDKRPRTRGLVEGVQVYISRTYGR